MVIANDKTTDAPASSADSQGETSHTYVGTRQAPRTYNNSDTSVATGRAITVIKVTDDLGERIEVRIGEAVILGPLFDNVLEELRAKRANEG